MAAVISPNQEHRSRGWSDQGNHWRPVSIGRCFPLFPGHRPSPTNPFGTIRQWAVECVKSPKILYWRITELKWADLGAAAGFVVSENSPHTDIHFGELPPTLIYTYINTKLP